MIGFAVRSIAAAALAGIAVAAAAGPESGKYCVFGKGKSYHMVLAQPRSDGMDVFPLGIRVGPSPPDFLEGENLTRIGCDQPRHGRRRP